MMDDGSSGLAIAFQAWYDTLGQDTKDEIDRRNEIMLRSSVFASNLRWYGCIDIVMPDG